jgi:hypothetical protein
MGKGYYLPKTKSLSCASDCKLNLSECTNKCILGDPGAKLGECVLGL